MNPKDCKFPPVTIDPYRLSDLFLQYKDVFGNRGTEQAAKEFQYFIDDQISIEDLLADYKRRTTGVES